MKMTPKIVFLSGYYLFILVWWLYLLVINSTTGTINYLFAAAFAVIPLMGGLMGLIEAKKWGGMQSVIGKALVLLSAGLLFWAGGQFIFAYYVLVLQVEVPYPSLADASFILAWPCWIVGVFYLAKAIGAKYGLKTLSSRLLAVFLTLVLSLISYYLLVIVAKAGSVTDGEFPLKTFFDLAYPILDLVALVVVVIASGFSFNYLGGRLRYPILLIFVGFIVNYIADFSFSYTTTVETFYNANWVDMLFATAMYFISIGTNSVRAED